LENKALKKEIDYRLSLIKENKTQYYTWEEVKSQINKFRTKSTK
jgi:hypothetical protein